MKKSDLKNLEISKCQIISPNQSLKLQSRKKKSSPMAILFCKPLWIARIKKKEGLEFSSGTRTEYELISKVLQYSQAPCYSRLVSVLCCAALFNIAEQNCLTVWLRMRKKPLCIICSFTWTTTYSRSEPSTKLILLYFTMHVHIKDSGALMMKCAV